MNNTRIYGDIVEISSDSVLEFYEKKSAKNPLNAVFLNDKLPVLGHNLRNEKEKEILLSFLDKKKYKILELGCALGRWVDNLGFEYIEKYDGIDFCKNFIDQAKEKFKEFSNINFYLMSIFDLDYNFLNEKYDLIIVSNCLMYVNDKEIKKIFKTLDKFLDVNGKIYFQDSISVIDERLTLKNFYSDEMKTNYSAIYRTQKEYIELVESEFKNLKLQKSGLILTKEMGARKETNSAYFCWSRV